MKKLKRVSKPYEVLLNAYSQLNCLINLVLNAINCKTDKAYFRLSQIKSVRQLLGVIINIIILTFSIVKNLSQISMICQTMSKVTELITVTCLT